MLAITRRVGETIVIGDPCSPLGTITVVKVHRDENKVRLSFDFPRDVEINRKEIADDKARQRAAQ